MIVSEKKLIIIAIISNNYTTIIYVNICQQNKDINIFSTGYSTELMRSSNEPNLSDISLMLISKQATEFSRHLLRQSIGAATQDLQVKGTRMLMNKVCAWLGAAMEKVDMYLLRVPVLES